VKKTTAKPSPRKSASSKNKDRTPGDVIAEAIINGDLDGYLGLIDDALEQRSQDVAKVEAAAKKTTTAKTEKKVSPPPKRGKSEPLTLKKDSTYAVSTKVKGLGGAKVKFHNYKTGSNKEKAVVEMLVGKPGHPKGKKVILPAAALVASKK
jgi:hypothetical protein